jgi:hypothetical protein
VKKLLLFTVTCLFLLGCWESSPAETRFVTIGTGGVTGVYFPVGGAISKLVNKKRSVYGLKLTAEATAGSVFNINSLVVGDMDFGLAQSDKAGQAWQGTAEWKDRGPQKSLRAICALQTETVCLIASVDSDIRKCQDLRGRIVAVGPPGSGTRDNSADALSTCGLSFSDLGKAEGIKPAEAASLLQDGRIEAYFYTVGHPNGSIKEAAAGGTKVRFVPLTNLDQLLKKTPYYSEAVIPIALYPGVENSEDVPTFGVRACLLTTERVPDTVVAALTRELFENLSELKQLHPALEKLTVEQMLANLPLPVHEGALAYFRERGLEKLVTTQHGQ